MSVYVVSFRLEYDDDYDKRYKSFTDELEKGLWWAETTSAYVVETEESISTFCDRIYYRTDFDSSKDMYLVLDRDVKAACVRGVVKDNDLFRLIPFVVQI